jgi:hypothetical protein
MNHAFKNTDALVAERKSRHLNEPGGFCMYWTGLHIDMQFSTQ